MHNPSRLAALLAALALLDISAQAQSQTSSTAKKHRTHKTPQPSFQTQLQQMRDQLQSEIDELKEKLVEKDSRIEALEAGSRANAATVAATAAQVGTLDANSQQSAAALAAIQSHVTELQTESVSVSTNIQQVQQATLDLKKSIDEPASLHFKGVTLTPGGFIAGESVWRQHALNSDIYTNFNATPYPGAGEAHTSEWVPSARQSRLSLLATGKTPIGQVTGYFEGDFLSAGSSSNNLETNSYPFRVRQAWGQLATGRFKMTAGQMWTLFTENKPGTANDPNKEDIPSTFDNNPSVGFTWLRQPGYRIAFQATPKLSVAAALENSQYQFSASNASANFFFGSAGAAAGLNNPDANYTNQVAPDVLVKASWDPGYGHYELGGVARFFRDRYYPNFPSTAAAANDTKLGGGFVANAKLPVTHRFDLGLHLVAGDGTGRYGASLLPDVTVHPNGTLEPLRNAQGLLSLEAHPTKKLDIFAYFGTEYVQRTTYRSATGTLVGYAPVTGVNTGCGIQTIPSGATGYNPGVPANCLGATRDLVEGSIGWTYRLYNGPAGKLQYGAAYSYLTRQAWTGVGGAPKAINNMVYTSVRYYIP
jgi:hypothetical protein